MSSDRRRKHPTQAELQELFFYDPGTGFLHWKIRPSKYSRAMWGDQVGGKPDRYGYLAVQLSGARYKQHNLVWIMHNGDIPDGVTVDHVNWNKADNRLDNLRLATARQQAINKRVKGFTKQMHCTLRPWKSKHTVDGRDTYIGHFPTALQARLAYERRTHELDPEFAPQDFTQWVDRLIREGIPS